jgi:hypothetical protein
MTARDTTPGPVASLLAADHRRLDALLVRAPADAAAYAEFRAGLLRHIGMEEKILLPAAQQARGGEPLAEAAQLRLDHGSLAALLVPPPTPTIVAAIRTILAAHNPREEGADGVYAACERLVDAEAVAARLRAAPVPPVNAHADGPLVRGAVRRAVARAGYDPDALGLAAGDE